MRPLLLAKPVSTGGPRRALGAEARSGPDMPRSRGVLPGSVLGALGGIRTPNLLIRSQMLYPLSYERWARRV